MNAKRTPVILFTCHQEGGGRVAKPGGLDALIDRAKRISFDSPIADGASQDGDGFGVSTLLNHVQQVGAATINPDSFDSKIAS